MKSDRLISIIVSTYNRADKLSASLSRILESVAASSIDCELICVDNNSTDHTRHIINGLTLTSSFPIIYVFERRQGLSYARNAGISKASGNIIAMTDDDCLVDSKWIDAIWREFESNPSLDLIGGRVELFDPRDLPVSVRTSRQRQGFAINLLFNLIPGCNLAFKRTVLRRAGIFDPRLGPGTPVGVADDLDFIYRVFASGHEIAYCPDVMVYHAHGRRTKSDLRILERGYLRGRGAFYIKHLLSRDLQVARLAYWETRNLIREIFQHRSPLPILRTMSHLFGGGLRYMWFTIFAQRRCNG
jgi:glycosyltransferase involved in cell wall biosynthesis